MLNIKSLLYRQYSQIFLVSIILSVNTKYKTDFMLCNCGQNRSINREKTSLIKRSTKAVRRCCRRQQGQCPSFFRKVKVGWNTDDNYPIFFYRSNGRQSITTLQYATDLYLPVSNSLSLGSVRSTGMKSFSQVMVGSGFPVALHNMTVFRSFSTAFKVGLSVILGYPLGATMRNNYEMIKTCVNVCTWAESSIISHCQSKSNF